MIRQLLLALSGLSTCLGQDGLWESEASSEERSGGKLEAEKARLLAELGLSGPPPASAARPPPGFALQRLSEARHAAKPQHFHLLVLSQPAFPSEPCADLACLRLALPRDALKHKLRSAALWLPLPHLPAAVGTSFTADGLSLQPLEARDGWLSLNASGLVDSWLSGPLPSARRTLRVACEGCEGEAGSLSSHEGFLELELRDPDKHWEPAHSVVKREAEGPDSEPGFRCTPTKYSHCCLQKHLVSFAEIGWDSWIIEPKTFYANYCSGNCRLSPTPLFHIDKGSRFRLSCCGPRRMAPITVTYQLDSAIRYEIISNMVVHACGCG